MKNILEDFEKVLRATPDKIMFSDVERTLTVKEVSERAKKIGTAIAKLNMKNQPFAIFDNRDVDTLCAMLDVAYSGNYYVVVDINSPAERARKIYDVLQSVQSIAEEKNGQFVDELGVKGKTVFLSDIYKESIDEQLF